MSHISNDLLVDSIIDRLEAVPATPGERFEVERSAAEGDLEYALYLLDILEAKYAEDLR